MVEPRPKSKINRSDPASTSVDALKLPRRGVGVPVPSSVTRISAAESLLAQQRAVTPAMVNARLSLHHMNISSGPSALVDLSCVGDSKLCERNEDANQLRCMQCDRSH